MPSTHGALSQEAINAALAATYGGQQLPVPSITRTTADRFRNQPKARGILSAPRPRGTLTKSASSLVEQGLKALGASEKTAARAGRSFEEINYDWNPLSGADIVGTQARRLTDGTGADVTDLALNAGMLAAPLAAPLIKRGAQKAAPIIKGVLKDERGALDIGKLIGDADIVTSPKKTAVVGADGKPKKVYHGTPFDFQDFKDRPRRDWFTDDPQLAETYANPRRHGKSSGANIRPALLDIQNPLDLDGLPEVTDDPAGWARQLGIDLGDAIEPGQTSSYTIYNNPRFSEEAKRLGFDGLKVTEGGKTTWAPLASDQIKPLFSPEGQAFAKSYGVLSRKAPEPLEGLPLRIRIGDQVEEFGPLDSARQAAESYASRSGVEYTPPSRFVRADPDRGRRIAEAYEAMPHDPTNPEVQEAYNALIKETLGQYQAAKAAGVNFRFMEPGTDPYGNPWNALKDIRENNSLAVFPTDAGYGSGEITEQMIEENPMLALIPGETWDGNPVRVNDAFRAVHDYFGHAKEGVGFRADGEENAFRNHAAMFSPPARRALATETRGQNSWLNFGPKGEKNRTAALEDTTFADQKIGLLPDWAVYEGTEDFLPDPRSTAYGYNEVFRYDNGMPDQEFIERNTEGLMKLLKERGVLSVPQP